MALLARLPLCSRAQGAATPNFSNRCTTTTLEQREQWIGEPPVPLALPGGRARKMLPIGGTGQHQPVLPRGRRLCCPMDVYDSTRSLRAFEEGRVLQPL
mmetsp:Transcript_44481/g.72372  ORF Transcript_44481/g.72372 Transcript_44481/m.72372 type:complete len:99 (-) Transcript_44481:427-723(-)